MGDIEIDERYYSKIKKMVTGPTVEVWMTLPEAVFLNFDFSKFIYIKHKDLQGYFFVEKIGDYKDGVTPVRLDLLYID